MNPLAAWDQGREPLPEAVWQQAEIQIKYEGYIRREEAAIAHFHKLEKRQIPEDTDFLSIQGLRLEARQKWNCRQTTFPWDRPAGFPASLRRISMYSWSTIEPGKNSMKERGEGHQVEAVVALGRFTEHWVKAEEPGSPDGYRSFETGSFRSLKPMALFWWSGMRR